MPGARLQQSKPTKPYARHGFLWCPTCEGLLRPSTCHDNPWRCRSGHEWQQKGASFTEAPATNDLLPNPFYREWLQALEDERRKQADAFSPADIEARFQKFRSGSDYWQTTQRSHGEGGRFDGE